MKTLLVDDDPAFRHLAGIAMEAAGVEYEHLGSAALALERLHGGDVPDLMLLDQGLPGMSGIELLCQLREEGYGLPIILVTVRDEASHRARALRLGADDYVVKPFSFDELLARIRAVVRRSTESDRPIRHGSLEIDTARRTVLNHGEHVELTHREFDVLLVLAHALGRTVSRKELLRRVWSMRAEPETNFLQVHVSRLRLKLRPMRGFRIETVRGLGYRLATSPPTSR